MSTDQVRHPLPSGTLPGHAGRRAPVGSVTGDAGHARFCLADPAYFETPERLPDTHSRYDAARRTPPPGWILEPVGLSSALRPKDRDMPEQGWKVHVSSTLDEVEQVIEVVYAYCTDRGIPFKFVRSRAAALAVSSKHWPRSASGKIVTIYPWGESDLSHSLATLDERLRGIRGPYVLSDLRYADGPLFVRYGAFRELWHTRPDGGRVLAVRRPDGSLVPDERGVTFRVPDFVEVPQVLRPSVADPPGHSDDFPYALDRALHFTNGGGVYVARRGADGEEVVLREARPHAGLDGRGRDAVARLRNERDVLRRLEGLACVPRLIDHLTAWEHEFLAVELVPGRSLLDEIVARYPLVHRAPTEDERRAFLDWAAGVDHRLERAVREIHARGVTVADLHPSNILVRPDGELVLVDFETSTLADDAVAPALGAPGFTAPPGVHGPEADHFAVERVHLMTRLPIVTLTGLAPDKVSTFRRVVAEELEGRRPGPDSELDNAAALFASGDWTSIRRQVVRGILASATPARRDRLFPGDPQQFTQGGATLAHGAAGVLMALAEAGEPVPEEHVDWLADVARSPDGCRGSGLYDGPHGAAYVLDLLGRRETAVEVMARAPRPDPRQGRDLYGGASGIALNLLHFGRVLDDHRLTRAAMSTADECRRGLLAGEVSAAPRAGLFSGHTGQALLCLAAFGQDGDQRFLDATAAALRLDLAAGDLMADGTFHLRSGPRWLPYLDGGSTGVALVLSRLLRERPDEELTQVLTSVHRACEIPFALQPGLFQGRSCLIALLAESAVTDPSSREVVATQVRRLGWHAIHRGDGTVFPGNGLVRLSTDLATGSAGVLTALTAAFERRDLALPHLPRRC